VVEVTRYELIEKAAEQIWREDMGSIWPLPMWSSVSNQASYRRQAQAVLDALLPQVTTAEEFTARAQKGSVLMGPDGYCLRWDGRRDPSRLLEEYGPLMVVWQP
jgi:hypothetical protein